MKQYLFTYRSVPGYDWFGDPTGLPDWQTFLETIEPNVIDPGWPSFEQTTLIGETGPSTQVGGYSVVTAESLEEALTMAKGPQRPEISPTNGGTLVLGPTDNEPRHLQRNGWRLVQVDRESVRTGHRSCDQHVSENEATVELLEGRQHKAGGAHAAERHRDGCHARGNGCDSGTGEADFAHHRECGTGCGSR